MGGECRTCAARDACGESEGCGERPGCGEMPAASIAPDVGNYSFVREEERMSGRGGAHERGRSAFTGGAFTGEEGRRTCWWARRCRLGAEPGWAKEVLREACCISYDGTSVPLATESLTTPSLIHSSGIGWKGRCGGGSPRYTTSHGPSHVMVLLAMRTCGGGRARTEPRQTPPRPLAPPSARTEPCAPRRRRSPATRASRSRRVVSCCTVPARKRAARGEAAG